MIREALLRLVERAIEGGELGRRDVLRIVCSTVYDPEWIRLDLGRWLTDVGVTASMGGEAQPLSPCPFTEKQLRDADDRNEIPVVIPGRLRREHLARAFNLRHWAFTDSGIKSMVDERDERKDRWLLVSAEGDLFQSGESCVEACAKAEKHGQTGLSLEEYVLFAYRFRYLTGPFPDVDNWTWLPKTSYASSLILCASFPANSELFFNVWPWSEFQSNLGLRVARRADSAT